MEDEEFLAYMTQRLDSGSISEDDYMKAIHKNNGQQTPPELIEPKQALFSSLNALEKLLAPESPPKVVVRSTKNLLLIYGFVDSAGSGFGGTFLRNEYLHYRIGTWSSEEKNNSSNWKEFRNLVDELKEANEKGLLNGATVIFATDNQTVEQALHKGNSSDKELYELVLEFRLLEMHSGAVFIVTHVSGKRMIAQGTDGVSRGSLNQGVTTGSPMLLFCPWNKSAFDVQPNLLTWLRNNMWSDLEPLTPEDWYERGHDLNGGYYDTKGFWRNNIKKGKYIWAPPPAAADACLEQLRIARLKRQNSFHVIVIPKLMTPLWLRQLWKASDFIFSIEAKHEFWSESNYESLIVGVIFPFLSFPPYCLQRTPRLCDVGRQLSRMYKESDVAQRNFLSKFCTRFKNISSLQESVVLDLLYFKHKYNISQCGRKKKRKREE